MQDTDHTTAARVCARDSNELGIIGESVRYIIWWELNRHMFRAEFRRGASGIERDYVVSKASTCLSCLWTCSHRDVNIEIVEHAAYSSSCTVETIKRYLSLDRQWLLYENVVRMKYMKIRENSNENSKDSASDRPSTIGYVVWGPAKLSNLHSSDQPFTLRHPVQCFNRVKISVFPRDSASSASRIIYTVMYIRSLHHCLPTSQRYRSGVMNYFVVNIRVWWQIN